MARMSPLVRARSPLSDIVHGPTASATDATRRDRATCSSRIERARVALIDGP